MNHSCKYRVYIIPIILLCIIIFFGMNFPFNTTHKIHEYRSNEEFNLKTLDKEKGFNNIDRLKLKKKLSNHDKRILNHSFDVDNGVEGNKSFERTIFNKDRSMPIESRKKLFGQLVKEDQLDESQSIKAIHLFKYKIRFQKHKLRNTYKNFGDFLIFFILLMILIVLSVVLEVQQRYKARHVCKKKAKYIKRTVNIFCIKEIFDDYIFYIIPLSIAVISGTFSQSVSTLTYILIEWSVPILSFVQFCRVNYKYAYYTYDKYSNKL